MNQIETFLSFIRIILNNKNKKNIQNNRIVTLPARSFPIHNSKTKKNIE